MKNSNFIEMWEFWIKEPPTMAISFDRGKTFEYKSMPIFPFYILKECNWICYKRKIPEEQKKYIQERLFREPTP